MSVDPVERYCSEILELEEGGSKIGDERAGLTTDMKGRWTIGAFDTKKSNKKETPSMKESVSEYRPLLKKDGSKKFVSVCAWCDSNKKLTKKLDDLGWTVSHGMCEKHFEEEVAGMFENIKEAIHPNNAGIMEVFQFFEKATEEEKKQFEELVNSGRQRAALQLMEKVLGITFQGSLVHKGG